MKRLAADTQPLCELRAIQVVVGGSTGEGTLYSALETSVELVTREPKTFKSGSNLGRDIEDRDCTTQMRFVAARPSTASSCARARSPGIRPAAS